MSRTPILLRCLAPLLLGLEAWSQSPVGELFPSEPGASPPAQLAGTGMTVVPGSHLSAGASPANLRLARGGQVRICPRSRLTVNSDARGLMLGMDAGSIEVDFNSSQGVVDMAYTPDFSILLSGPGTYHFALGVTAQGDTCIKPLPGNTSGVVFSELLGSDVYGLAADETALFSGGKLSQRTSPAGDCGCPAPAPFVRADAAPPKPPEQPVATPAPSPTHGLEPKEPSPAPSPEPGAPSPVTVDAPFVFSASEATPAPMAKLEYSSLPNVVLAQEEPDPGVLSGTGPEPTIRPSSAEPAPTPAAKKQNKKGFMARLKGFFGGLFGR
jgi:hypothetical protein